MRLLPALCLLTFPVLAQTTRYRDLVFAAYDRNTAIAYGSAVNRFTHQTETLLLDLYQPRGDTDGSRPAIVVVHGGGFVGGSRGASQMVQLGADLARRGYVAVSIDYRLAPSGNPITAQVIEDAGHDCKAAVRWLRANAASLRLDQGRIAAIGSSAGGYTILEAAYADHGEGSSGNPGHDSSLQVVADLWGAMLDPTLVEAVEAPLIIVHGTADPVVPFAAAQALAAQATAVGLPFELWPIQGAGHAPWSTYFQGYHERFVAFCWRHLRLGERAGLAIRAGYASPGVVTVDLFGLPGDLGLVALADQVAPQPLPPLGTLHLAGTIVSLPFVVLAASPPLPVATLLAPVPPGLGGLTVHWQGLTTDGFAGVLTNPVTIVL